jgi:N-glycosylase/DNA lyase
MKTFNHRLTLLGGQAFNWDEIEKNRYLGFFQDKIIEIDYNEDLKLKGTIDNLSNWYKGYITEYTLEEFDNNDAVLKQAIKKIGKIYLLKQPFEQTLLSYILATNKNIPAIRQSVRKLTNILGQETKFKNKKLKLFPNTKSIADADIQTLQRTKIGYRAPYLKDSANKLIKENIPNSKQEEVRNWLISFPGIGPKVADCILLYSLGYKNVIPLDVWMQRVLKERYYLPNKYKYEDMRKWYKEKWKDNSGIVGQYLFEAYRK